MRVAIVTQWYSEGLGYSENLLSAELARAGLDVHIISGRSNVYAHTPKYDSIYRPVLGDADLECGQYPTGTSAMLHRIPSSLNIPAPGVLYTELSRLQPDIVQTFSVVDQWSVESADFCSGTGTPLFTENHVHESVIPRGAWQTPRGWLVGLANRIRPSVRRVNGVSVACLAISEDTYRVANRRFGVPRNKLLIQPLGVDTSVFKPAADHGARRLELRRQLGFGDDEVVCIYTGRLSPDKAPTVLADAVALLRSRGHPVRGLFVGAGAEEYVHRLASTDGCVTLPFRPTAELPELYQVADVGVWPREESTSQLDAMACGLPIIVSDMVSARERRGVGGDFREGSPDSLSSAINSLLPEAKRAAAGKLALDRIDAGLSWRALAQKRIDLYAREIAIRHTSQ